MECDRKMGVRLKNKVYKIVVRPALISGAETWSIKKAQEMKINVAERRMLRWMCVVTLMDKIWNETIRGTVKVMGISKKLQARRLQRVWTRAEKGWEIFGKRECVW